MSSPNDRRRRRRRTILVLLAAAALSLFTFAFTAANIVPGSRAGDGAGTITGYTVSNVEYALDATNPANIESVSFTLDATAGTVKAKLVQASGTYTDCTNTGGNDWSCDVEPDPTVLSVDELRVIATQ
jgi:FlaG/FlaF family flagellin (archaellin)